MLEQHANESEKEGSVECWMLAMETNIKSVLLLIVKHNSTSQNAQKGNYCTLSQKSITLKSSTKKCCVDAAVVQPWWSEALCQ